LSVITVGIGGMLLHPNIQMRVLFVTRGFPSEKNIMSGNYEAVQAKAIAAKGHDVSVIAIKWKNPLHILEFNKVNHRVVDGIHIYECIRIMMSIPHIFIPKLERWVRQRQFLGVFRRYMKEMGMPDVVHAHMILYASPAMVLKEKYQLPVVITEHWSQMNKENTHKRIMNDTFSYFQADKVICVSDALAESIRKKCHVDSIVIHNMVSDQFFESQKIKHQEGSFKFVAIGALRFVKRFDLLADAFYLCHFPNHVSLEIVGDGKERPLIESKIKEYHLEQQVKLLGVKSPEEVSALLCHSDCFVLSSRLETFAIVLLEAMAKGLPVIATRCGGPDTFVRPEDGLLVPNEDAEALAGAMTYMKEHYQEYNAEEIRRHCHDHFSQDVIADKIIEVYQQVINH